MKYRKKPVIVDAIQIKSNPTQLKEFVGDNASVDILDAAWQAGAGIPTILVTIQTLEGKMYAGEGDYIVKGIKGEYYPCKPDIFEQTYEKVEESE